MGAILAAAGLMLNAYDPDAVAIFDQMAVDPSGPRRMATSRLIKALRAVNFWSFVDAFYLAKGAQDAQSGFLDWRRPGVSATAHASAAWSGSGGFCGSAAAGSYFNSRFNPAIDGVNFLTGDCSIGCLVVGLPSNTSGTQYYTGGYANGDSGKIIRIYQEYNSGAFMSRLEINCGASIVGGVHAVGVGLIVARRVGDVVSLYRDGVLKNQYTKASGGLSSVELDICAQCANGTHGFGNCDVQIGVWFAGAGSVMSVDVQNAVMSALNEYFLSV